MGRLRVLFLASFFPKPDNPWMGTWALAQAQALARQDVDLRVVSFTSWVPQALALSTKAKAYANCPTTHLWAGQVEAYYPRWLYYSVPPLKQWAYQYPMPFLKLMSESAKPALKQAIAAFQPDVIFCHHSLPNGWLLSQLAAQDRIPFVTLDHDFDEIADCYRLPRRRAALAAVAANAWIMLSVSRRMQDDLQQLFPATNVMLLHNGVEMPQLAKYDRPRPPELQRKQVILCCALFTERKGIPLLVEAFSQVASNHPDAILRIIGNGSEMEKIRQAIDRFELGDRVQLVGKKLHNEVLQEMLWADCFALVGWDEPFATVYLEAMAAGTPIICCDDGGINDVFESGVHGWAVPPKDIKATVEAIDWMLSHPQERSEMGKQAQRLVQKSLTWDAKAVELLQIFEGAIAAQSPKDSLRSTYQVMSQRDCPP
jgi:glycosyltransferase involved in cell wall biosynthesis